MKTKHALFKGGGGKMLSFLTAAMLLVGAFIFCNMNTAVAANQGGVGESPIVPADIDNATGWGNQTNATGWNQNAIGLVMNTTDLPDAMTNTQCEKSGAQCNTDEAEGGDAFTSYGGAAVQIADVNTAANNYPHTATNNATTSAQRVPSHGGAACSAELLNNTEKIQATASASNIGAYMAAGSGSSS